MSGNEIISGREYCQIIESDLNDIKNTATAIERQIGKIKDTDDVATVKSRIQVLMQETEKMALKGRAIPLFINPQAIEVPEQEGLPLKVVCHRDTLLMEVPLLIPKSRSNKANKNYLVSMFHRSFKDYFTEHDVERYREPVLIWFEFQYCSRKGKNTMRDHDNVETKIVKDLLIPYIITDDCPIYCDDLYTSRYGDYDATFIHIVPRRMFPEYFKERVDSYEVIS